MTITKEVIEARKAQLQADFNALYGAIQDCDHWLKKLEEEETGIPLEDLIPGAVVEDIVEVDAE